MRQCFLFILLFAVLSGISCDVIFTSERCNRVTYGLRTVNGDPTRYKQCGPSGRVWIVPCAPQMTFDPQDRVCKERMDMKGTVKPMRKYETPKNIITTPAPSQPLSSASSSIPSYSPPRSSEFTTPASAPEEFVFSTVRPKRPRIKSRTRGKTRKTTTEMVDTTTTTIQPSIVIFANKPSKANSVGGSAAFTRPGRIRTTPPTTTTATTMMAIPVTHATRFIPGIQRTTVIPKEMNGMPHTLAPYEKIERNKIEEDNGEEVTTIVPEYTVRYNGQSMSEAEFLSQLLHIVQHQKAVAERQQTVKFQQMENERLRQEKEEREREMERRRQLEEAEKMRQIEMEKQAMIYAEQERMAMERERELERIRQDERKRENERIRQEEIAREVIRMRELEKLQLERQQKNERIRQQQMEMVRKQKEMEEKRQNEMKEKIREIERQREIERIRQEEEEREQEMRRQQTEEMERQNEIERIRENERRIKMEKENAERMKAIEEEKKRREIEEERRREKEREEREYIRKIEEEQQQMKKMEKEREMMREIIENENRRIEQQTFISSTPVSTLKPIYRPQISEYQPPDVESQMIRFTTQSPEWVTAKNSWKPDWNTVTEGQDGQEEGIEGGTVVYRGCLINGDCELKYDHDSFCTHPTNPSSYLQCAPLYGRVGRWTERQCPDTLIFMVSIGRCEKSMTDNRDGRKPYDPDNRVVIPRLPSETSFVEWKGNRVIDQHPIQPIGPPRVYPPVPETHQPQIYNTIDEFPKDLLPRLPEVSPAETYAQQYQNHIHGSVISQGYPNNYQQVVSQPATVTRQPLSIPQSYQIPMGAQASVNNNNQEKSEIDLSHIHPLFPRVQPDFLSRILPGIKFHDDNVGSDGRSIGSVVKPVLKQLALNQTEMFLDRLLADRVTDPKIRQEIIDRLKSSNAETLSKPHL